MLSKHIIGFGLIFLAACTKSTNLRTSAHNNALSCTQKEFHSETVTVCLDSVIEDSRCPVNMECIWGGMVTARFTISANSQQRSFTLSSNKNASGYSSEISLLGYKVQLIDILPHPGETTPATTKAELQITPL